jgi:hypothetical protein
MRSPSLVQTGTRTQHMTAESFLIPEAEILEKLASFMNCRSYHHLLQASENRTCELMMSLINVLYFRVREMTERSRALREYYLVHLSGSSLTAERKYFQSIILELNIWPT